MAPDFRLYRFSPIRSKVELLRAIEYLHVTSHRLCHETFGEYLPASGAVGIFCHFEDEYEFLTTLRKELTNEQFNYNGKYFLLKERITIPERGHIPSAAYSLLYIRKPDPYRGQVGDVDFVLPKVRHARLRDTLSTEYFTGSLRLFGRKGDNMIELSRPEYDVLSYIVDEPMTEKSSINDAHIRD